MNYFIENATLVNEGRTFVASVFVSDGWIAKIIPEGEPFDAGSARVVDGSGKFLIPGIIDEHVHFREPGLTHKADIYTESRAAVAGGVTSFMARPSCLPLRERRGRYRSERYKGGRYRGGHAGPPQRTGIEGPIRRYGLDNPPHRKGGPTCPPLRSRRHK